MKVAISCKAKSLAAEVDARFGRAAYFCIYDVETDNYSFVDNQLSSNSPSGAGVQAAQAIVDSGVSAVLTGHCGPKAFRALVAAGIKVYADVAGTVQEAVSALRNNELAPATIANADGHWE
ncbi:dinitrogenase iron-molybdenum cofactor biosynthesis protein [candidate division KSB1 bacterium]|nr:NifB/NifX family molybdenum-iron cluster-binding protein [candidate division KSB1 bacterium]RQW00317.1 MAG: dinitrogenase iron-molybdenum cofactor biosynthesis protein [candidate division KSB1 bacterium]